MKQHFVLLSALLLSSLVALHATEFYVSPNGTDEAAGTLDAPLRTIQQSFQKAGPGDTIFLREGTYREAVTLKTKSGKEGAPITLKAYQGEKPVLSGLDILKLSWAETAQTGIYVADLDAKSVLQLFYNGKPMLEARWPDCPKDSNGDWNFFSPDIWASADTSGNSYGTLACEALAKTGWDVTGALALLNVDHQFFCWTRPVLTHTAGSGVITYEKDLGKSVDKGDEGGVKGKWDANNKFYLFGKKEFLNAPGEWFYDAAKKKLFLFSPDDKTPSLGQLEIKTRDWGFTADSSCNYLTIFGLEFFGTAFKFGESPDKRSSHIVLRNCTFFQGSWTEYLSLNKSRHEGKRSELTADSVFPTILADDSQVVNNTFAYGALSALLMNGLNNLIENNLIHDFDYSSSLVYPPLQVNHPGEGLTEKAGHDVIRYNTICRSGGIQARMTQPGNEFYMNDVHESFLACFGGNKDTSAVYTQKPLCTGTRFHHNWVHHGFSGTPPLPWGGGMGIRGDDMTCGLTVDHNVVWDCGSAGIMIKNVLHPLPDQANGCVNNTVFGHSTFNSIKSAIIISKAGGAKTKELGKNAPGAELTPSAGECPNALSTVANNLADSIYGQWNAKPLGNVKIFSNNDLKFNVDTDLVNKAWCDFRPVAKASGIINQGIAIEGISPMVGTNAPDIGAYQRGDVTYWIPGQRLAKASFPIVPDKAQSVPTDRDTLMWKPAYQAVRHTLYFAPSEEDLAKAEPKTFEGEENVFKLPNLSSGKSYFWRVDAVMPDKTVIKGDVWTFTTKNN